MEWYLKVLRQYADFNGRARRKEYWMFGLINSILPIAIAGIICIIGAVLEIQALMIIALVLILIYYVATLVPTIAVVVRRLHDTNNSGLMYFVTFIPMIGSIWLLVLMCQAGDYGDNSYGADPKLED